MLNRFLICVALVGAGPQSQPPGKNLATDVAIAEQGSGPAKFQAAMNRLLRATSENLANLEVEMGSSNPRIRMYAAVGAIEGVKTKAAWASTVALLSDKDDDVAGVTAHELGQVRYKGALKELERLALSARLCRGNAIVALGRIGDPSANDVLIRVLEGTDKLSLDSTALIALTGTGIQNRLERSRIKRRLVDLHEEWTALGRRGTTLLLHRRPPRRVTLATGQANSRIWRGP